MKKSILFLTFFLSAVLLARGSDLKEINLNFNAADFSFSQENGAYSISSEKFPVIFDTDTLAPALPYFLVNVLIAPNQEFEGLTLNGGESLLRADIRMTPNKLPVPTNALETEVPNQITSYALTNYPSEEVRYVSTSTLGNYKYVALLVCPLHYDAQKHALFLKENLTISLSLRTTNSPSMFAAFPQSESYQAKKRSEINQLVYNTEDIETLYPITQHGTLTEAYPTKYLVITNEALKPAFQRLANWKTTKGVKSKVLTMEEINQKYNDSIVPLRIKRAIMEYKGQLEYVLLGGDVEIVPSLKCYVDTIAKSPTRDVPADLYYASFSNLDWDKNRNGRFGERSDKITFTSDIAVSRLSVYDLDGATKIVEKLIKYEKEANLYQLSDSLLLCGVRLYNMDTIPQVSGDTLYISDAQQDSEELYENQISPYWKGKRIRFFDTFTDFPEGDCYHVTPLHLQEQLSRGYFLVNELSHGWINAWGGLEGRDAGSDKYTYENDLAESLVNPKYTTIVTGACCVNWFDLDKDSLCLGEAFMRNENSNVIAFVGYSREGFVSTHRELIKYFYDGIFKLGMSTAEAVAYAKNKYPYHLWTIFALNTLGDPEEHLYLSKPKPLKDVQIHYENNQISITLDQDSCNVCLTNIDEKGNISFFRMQHLQGNIFTFEQFPDQFTVCITKEGFVPYCVDVIKKDNGDVYLQNITFNTNTTVVGKNIFAGKDIKHGEAIGPVHIQNGNISFQAEQTVKVKNDFKVEAGASLKVRTN